VSTIRQERREGLEWQKRLGRKGWEGRKGGEGNQKTTRNFLSQVACHRVPVIERCCGIACCY